MDRSALFLEKTAVNHLLGQGTLEHILQIRLEGPCVDQIQTFQPGQMPVEVFL